MKDQSAIKRDLALDPASRISEILFGLIMVLTFTSSVSATNIIRDDVREMLIGALGCNLAWGIIDAFMYLINIAAERGREELTVLKLYSTSDQATSRALIRDLMPELIGPGLSDSVIDQISSETLKVKRERRKIILTLSDLRSAALVFALVFLTIFPVAVPFMFMQDMWQALRVSNLIALFLLFGLGINLGKYAGRSPIFWGVAMTTIGVILVSIAIAFGG